MIPVKYFRLTLDIYCMLEVPSTGPLNFVATSGNLAATSVIISWDPPLLTHQNGFIIRYKIVYWLQQANIAANRSTIVVLGNVTRYTVYNLIPSSNYSMQIAAATSVGFGPYYTPIFHLTSPAGTVINK